MRRHMINVYDNKKRVPGDRKDPFLAFNFVMEIDGVVVGGFTDVSGLSVETQVERKTFGGENHREYTFFTQTKYTDITLKHGLTTDDYLWKWYEKVVNGVIKRRNGSLCLLDHDGAPKIWWDIYEACPIKWEGPSFSASTNAIAVETIVLTHNGIRMHK